MAETKMIPGVGLVRKNDDGTFEVIGPSMPEISATPLPVNPVRAAREAQDRARQEAADARADRDQARQEAKDRRDELEWNATHNPDGSPKAKASTGKPMPDGVAKRYEEAINAFGAFNRATNTFNDDFAGNTLTGGLENNIQNVAGGFGTPGQAQWWSDFRATDNVLRNALYGASLTAGEKSAYESTTIKPNMDPAEIKANLTRRMALAKDLLSRRTNYLKANGYDPDAIDALSGEYGDMIAAKPEQKADNELPDPTTGANLKQPAPGLVAPGDGASAGGPDGGPGGGGLSVASGDTREVFNERMSSQVDAMVNAGASLGMINAVMKRQGRQPITSDSYSSAKQWMKTNPGKRYYGAQITDVKDMTALQKAAGSDTGAFVAQMANAATAGVPAALAGPSGQGALDAMAANSPNASTAGQLIGGVTGAMGGEAAVAARAPAALARYAPAIADTLFGGLTGFNSARDGDGGMGALTGAGAGLVGSLAGQGVVRAAGAASRGVRSQPVQYLRDQGIPLTVGQTVGDSGRIGAGVKKIEDAMTSVPFVGSMVEARRMEGLQGFNRAAFGTAAAPQTTLTATGAEGLGELRQGVQDAYGRALDPVTINANDPDFISSIAGVNAAASRIPNVNGAQDAATAALQNRIDGAIDPMTDQMTGRGFQEAYRGLARTGRERASGDYGYEVGQTMRQGQNALAGALERQNPGAFDQFLEANAANRRMNVLAGAMKNAGNQAEELITPAQLNRADIQSTSRLEGQIDSAAGNRPFYDLATAGQEVLPSKLPDSGTATRALIGGGLTGLGLGGAGYAAGGGEGATAGVGSGLGLSLLLAAGGSRPAQAAMTRMLLDRPDMAIRFGDILQQQARLGGAVGTGVATQQTVGY